ncbi:MAG: PAS domain-containing protein [Cyanobacteria bacterium REEB67]|nr:PAS domain-containing protein [Cyanobacteria bacterium REEB67]
MQVLSSAQCHTIASVFEDIALAIVATDKHGAVTFFNPAAATIIGMEQVAVSPEDWSKHYGVYLSDGVTLCPAAESPLVRALAGDDATGVEVFIQNRLGSTRSRWCTIDFKPIRGDAGDVTGALLLVQDISERKKLSEEVTRSNIALQQFATVAAHDLQEPLRSIAGFTDMLAQYQGEQLDEKSERCMGKIKNGVKRMQTLINDLLSYSRIQTTAQILQATDCNAILAACIKTLNASITESEATISVDPLPVVMADASQIAQVFQNLVGNALKFCAADRPPLVQISAQRQATAWLFSVKDNGIGIAPEFAERVFRIFQRLHSQASYAGTGIGLAVCQTIVDRHGGRIWVESEPGNGSTFYFTIPERGGDAV